MSHFVVGRSVNHIPRCLAETRKAEAGNTCPSRRLFHRRYCRTVYEMVLISATVPFWNLSCSSLLSLFVRLYSSLPHRTHRCKTLWLRIPFRPAPFPYHPQSPGRCRGRDFRCFTAARRCPGCFTTFSRRRFWPGGRFCVWTAPTGLTLC